MVVWPARLIWPLTAAASDPVANASVICVSGDAACAGAGNPRARQMHIRSEARRAVRLLAQRITGSATFGPCNQDRLWRRPPLAWLRTLNTMRGYPGGYGSDAHRHVSRVVRT